MSDEIREVVTCNVSRGHSAYSAGAKAYLLFLAGGDRCNVLVRSRSGRWIRMWVHRRDVTNWRHTTVVSESSAYHHLHYFIGSHDGRALPADWPSVEEQR